MAKRHKPIKSAARVKAGTAGARIIDSLKELTAALESGQPLSKHFTVRTVTIPEPSRYDAKSVRELRERIGLSQGLFGQLVGVSKKLVEAWEAGTRTPAPMACRLLDAIAREPGAFVTHTQSTAA